MYAQMTEALNHSAPQAGTLAAPAPHCSVSSHLGDISKGASHTLSLSAASLFVHYSQLSCHCNHERGPSGQ